MCVAAAGRGTLQEIGGRERRFYIDEAAGTFYNKKQQL
ncbi:hypothetical protein HMPREF0889_1639 [Megasphaera lornae]|uniref:Uncharacterized protein n=1 Tax=Megasphaera lornae TaxID=1000568 RepID=D3LUU1_9FIRM|nr:hypothetical protein HMPREF0889_1639 [Megasphaera genomosp. type_1 str. 28L]